MCLLLLRFALETTHGQFYSLSLAQLIPLNSLRHIALIMIIYPFHHRPLPPIERVPLHDPPLTQVNVSRSKDRLCLDLGLSSLLPRLKPVNVSVSLAVHSLVVENAGLGSAVLVSAILPVRYRGGLSAATALI